MARGRRAPVKAFLLDQRRIAGVGNIYADEALFRARIHPLRPAGSLTRAQYDALAGAVRDALTAGLAAGGATIDDFRHADGVARRVPGRVPRPPPPGRAVPRVRHGRRQVRGGGAGDVRVRVVPAASARAAVAASCASNARLTSQAAAEAGQGAVGADEPVARQHDRQRVAPVRGADGAGGPRRAERRACAP